MSFYNVVFPENLSYGTKSGASFATAIRMSDSGVERRTSEWQPGRHRMQYDVAKETQTEDELGELLDFYLCVRGSAGGFRFKDVTDFTTAADGVSTPQLLADAAEASRLGSNTIYYQMQKSYANDLALGEGSYTRTITRPIQPDMDGHYVRIWFNGQLVWESVGSGSTTVAQGVEAAIDYSQGRVIFNTTPSAGTKVDIGCTFHVPARFDQDVDEQLDTTWEAAGQFTMPSLKIVEITRDLNTHEEEWMENGHEVNASNPESGSLDTFGSVTQNFRVHHHEVQTTTNASWYLGQLLTSVTGGPAPQVSPLANGEYYTGGPLHVVSSNSASSHPLNVVQRSPTGTTYPLIATLSANQYVEIFWMGNAIGAVMR